ncbi:Sorting nexin-16 [Homalodisca vitripennis]|nr:Sorting nexin-16 [Homalodisca vitripennis]
MCDETSGCGLKCEFPKKVLTLPRKRWFGNNFSQSFIEERLHGLQKFIDTVTSDKELLASQNIRDFFCLDEPPSFSEIGEESRLKCEFPKKVLTLPRKRWFGNNFSQSFIEERLHGLQKFIDTVTSDKELLASQNIRDFFCLDEPPSFSEIGEESRAIFEALEETIYQLRRQLRLKETEIMNMRMSVTGAQEKAVTISQTLKEVACCDNCKDKVQNISEDLQRVLCLQFSNLCS